MPSSVLTGELGSKIEGDTSNSSSQTYRPKDPSDIRESIPFAVPFLATILAGAKGADLEQGEACFALPR